MFNPLFFEPGCNTEQDVRSAQIRLNAQRNIPWLKEQPPTKTPLAIVAGGPSLKNYLEVLRDFPGPMLVLNNAYRYVMAHGFEPEYFMLLDARQENIEFVKGFNTNTTHFLNAQCHPDIFDLLADNAVLYFSHEETAKSIDQKKIMLAAPSGTVGMKALSLAFTLGYRELHLFGYDSSHTEQHHAFEQSINDGAKTIDVFIEQNGKKYITTPSLAHQASEFVPFAKDLTKLGCDIFLRCEGLLPDLVQASNQRGTIDLEQREKEKYKKIWEIEKYGEFAPGEQYVEHASRLLGIKAGDSLIDYGCGSGKAAKAFAEKGVDTTGIDFVRCDHTGFAFIESCLWDLPELSSDWAYCTDVMEHIPPEKVLDVLSGIKERTRKGAFFNIATRDDVMGSLIGKRLHLTVITAHAWLELLEKFWSVHCVESDGEAQFICT